MKSKIKYVILVSFLLLLTSFISVYAASEIFAYQISYREGTVEDALDDLYTAALSGGGHAVDISNKTTLNNQHYQLTKSTLLNDTADKILIIHLSATMIDNGYSSAFTIDISDLGLNSIKKWQVSNYLSSNLSAISTSVTTTSIYLNYDPYYGRTSKADYDFAVIIQYT